MKSLPNLKKFLIFPGFFLLVFGFTGCSDDDDETLLRPTGEIVVDDNQNLTRRVLTVQSVTVGQNSWLTAVKVSEENSNNFIAQPVLVETGTTNNVPLTINQNVITLSEIENEVVLKLYADNPGGGTVGAWDSSDIPITNSNNVLVTKTITIHGDAAFIAFESFDLNGNGTLDSVEIIESYPNYFDIIWDADEDGNLSPEEFYDTTYYLANPSRENDITEAEWNEGYLRMYGNWAEDNFIGFDEDENGLLSKEEWHNIFSESGWFEAYDTDSDNLVSEDEWNAGLFSDWDLNDDGVIDEEEYRNLSPFVSGWPNLLF